MNVLIYDIETLKELFLVVVYKPDTDVTYEFQVSRWTNQLDAFIRFTEEHDEHYWVGYNNLRFDSQVVEHVLRNYEHWHEMSGLEICAIIAQKAADTIHDANYDVFPEYKEEWLSLKQLDLFKINHYDNKNRRVSLKRLEFEMDFENIEEMPIHHLKENMTKEEVIETIYYCHNDVQATYEFYKITTGDTEHPLYKGNNQVELRQDIYEEFGIHCLNYSDSKIGDEMIKKYYCEQKNIQYSDLPKKGLFRTDVKLRDCIADYVIFQTPELQAFLKRISKERLTMKDEFKESLEFYGNTYTFAKGGLHTENKPKVFEADDDTLIIDWDVSSYYPAIIINNGRYPGHLGSEFLRGYKTMFDKRLELKPLAKKDKKIKGIIMKDFKIEYSISDKWDASEYKQIEAPTREDALDFAIRFMQWGAGVGYKLCEHYKWKFNEGTQNPEELVITSIVKSWDSDKVYALDAKVILGGFPDVAKFDSTIIYRVEYTEPVVTLA